MPKAAARPLDTATLDAFARTMAGQFFLETRFSPTVADRPIAGRDWVINSLYDATFKDEFDYLLPRVKAHFGQDTLAEFNALAAERFTPRDARVFEELLARKLAINPAGEHIKGMIGTTQIGGRILGLRTIEVEDRIAMRQRKRRGLSKDHRVPTSKVVKNKIPIFAGEAEEGGYRSLKEFLSDQHGALNTNISAEVGILALDALLDGLDEGSSNAILQGRTGAQPADPDAATTGTLLFTCACSDPAFAGATDQANGTVRASASAISDDTSADATGTLGYVRASATNDGSTPIDDHIDGEAGTSSADWIFNTLAIVAGATISITGWTVTFDQGTTAS